MGFNTQLGITLFYKIMSEQDIDIIKQHFINEYKQNGGTEDLSKEPVKIIMMKNQAQKEIASLKEQLQKANSAPPEPKPKFNAMNGGINMGRYNADMATEFAKIFGAYHDYIEPPFDKRILKDESFKRDNALIIADQAVVLRDEEGRCDCGGPTKYERGLPSW